MLAANTALNELDLSHQGDVFSKKLDADFAKGFAMGLLENGALTCESKERKCYLEWKVNRDHNPTADRFKRVFTRKALEKYLRSHSFGSFNMSNIARVVKLFNSPDAAAYLEELREKVGEIPENTTVEDGSYQFKVRR